jgi:hypothetical protein
MNIKALLVNMFLAPKITGCRNKMRIVQKYFLISMAAILLLGCNRQKPLNQNRDYITISINPKEALKTVNMSEYFRILSISRLRASINI